MISNAFLFIILISNTFDMVNKEAKKIWAFQRYNELIHEYIDRPILPAPFIILSFIYKIILELIRLCCRNTQVHASNEQLNKLPRRLFTKIKRKYINISANKKKDLIEWLQSMSEEFYFQKIESVN